MNGKAAFCWITMNFSLIGSVQTFAQSNSASGYDDNADLSAAYDSPESPKRQPIQKQVPSKRRVQRRYSGDFNSNGSYRTNPREESLPDLEERRNQRGRRRIARTYTSLDETQNYTRARVRKTLRPEDNSLELHLGLLSGLTSFQGGGEKSKFTLGFVGDFRATYFSLEVDGYYGFSAATLAQAATGISLTSSTEPLGGFVNANGQIPFYTGSVKWTPKLGIGYGYTRLKNSTVKNLTDTTTINSELYAPYGIAGLEFEPWPFLVITTDYSRSFLSSGKQETQSTDSQDVSDIANGAYFDRIRVGAHFRVIRHFILGLDYHRRNINFGEGFSDGIQNQFLGLIMYEL